MSWFIRRSWNGSEVSHLILRPVLFIMYLLNEINSLFILLNWGDLSPYIVSALTGED